MEKNKVLVLAGTLAVSGAMLLHSDVVNAASTTGSATVATTAASNLQNGSYTATANFHKSGTSEDSRMSAMLVNQADIVIKKGNATIQLSFTETNTAKMVAGWAFDGVAADIDGAKVTVTVPVADLNKVITSEISIQAGTFSEKQPVDLQLTDLKFVARDPEEVAAEEKAKADADAKAEAEKAKQAAQAKAAAEAAAKAKAEQEAANRNRNQGVSAQYEVHLYKTGTTEPSMMDSRSENGGMVSSTAKVVTKDGQATVTLQFKDMATINMVKSWVINGVAATKIGQSFVVVLPASDLGKTLHTVISVATTIGGVPFSETQPVDLVLQAGKLEPDVDPDENKNASPAQTLGHDVPLTAQLSSTSKLPNTATNETTTAPLLAALVSGVLALGIWFKKVLR